MIKPITYSSHCVTYKVMNGDKTIESATDSACFSQIFKMAYNMRNEIELLNFLRVETAKYAPDFIKKISRICGVKTVFISEDHIRVSGFKNKFLMKTFLTMYRLLFESNTVYNVSVESVIKQRILFFEAFVNKSEVCEHRCNLKRLLHFHNLHIKNTLGNCNHCLTSTNGSKLLIKSKLQLLNHKFNDKVHEFFN